MKGLSTWQLIKDSLDSTVPVMLLYVLESRGSSPGRQGFFMAVTAEGKMEGSIGGGMMEHKLVEKARSRLQDAGGWLPDAEIIKQVHDKAAAKNQSGMICSGEQTVLLYQVQKNEAGVIKQIIDCLFHQQTAMLKLSPAGIEFNAHDFPKDFLFHYNSDEDWLYRQRLGCQNHLYIIGGGHCALALSNLMRSLDFYIHVFDDRQGLHTMQQNEAAHKKATVDDYSELSSLIPSGQNIYVVIMTFGYRTDDVAVRPLLNKEFKYIGVLGSKSKIKKMFAAYRQEGIDENKLLAFHAPVGLAIKSETPEEIAVSIAAEIIACKNAASLQGKLSYI